MNDEKTVKSQVSKIESIETTINQMHGQIKNPWNIDKMLELLKSLALSLAINTMTTKRNSKVQKKQTKTTVERPEINMSWPREQHKIPPER